MNLKLLSCPYTYFETNVGSLAYSFGHYHDTEKKLLVSCFVGYFTDTPTSRIQLGTHRYMEKIMWHGFEGSWKKEEYFSKLPDPIYKEFIGTLKKDVVTGENVIVIPVTDIKKIYSPRQSLQNILRKKWLVDETKYNAVKKFMDIFARYDISIKDVGIYGSLQIGVMNNSPKTDIDFLIYGTKNYEKVLRMTQEQPNKYYQKSKYNSINEIESWRLAREARDKASKLFLDENTHADIKVVRNLKENNPFEFRGFNLEREIEITGEVIDSSHALSVPAVFVIKNKGEIYTIISRKYIFIGAARNGDRVKVRGKKILNSNIILLTDPKSDYINTVDSIQ